MRSPTPSFRSELAAYRQRLSDKTQILAPHWKGDLANGIIDRWLEHPEAESIWTTLKANVPPGLRLSDDAAQSHTHIFVRGHALHLDGTAWGIIRAAVIRTTKRNAIAKWENRLSRGE
jgi:hypothetical protein